MPRPQFSSGFRQGSRKLFKEKYSPMNRGSRVAGVLCSVWLIASAAFATRAGFLWYQQHHIPHQVLAQVPFDQEAGNIAFALSQGRGFGNLFRQSTGPTAWLAPIYPLLLSFIFRLLGPFTFGSFVAAALLNCLFSAAVTFPLYDLARRIGGRGVAAGSCWLWVFLPSGILMPTEWIWDTALSVLLATTLLWATIRLAESVRILNWLAYSLLWALALLTNPSLGIAIPVLILWAGNRARKLAGFSWRLPATSLALGVVCCIPWTVRNHSQFDRWIPIRSNFAFELWIGNNDIFDPHAIGGRQRITRYEETRHYSELGESAYLDEKWKLANDFIAARRSVFLQLTKDRIVATWTGTEHPLSDFRKTDSMLARAVIASNLILLIGTLGGMFALAVAKNPLFWPVAAWPLFYPLVYYATHTSLRYRHPLDPVLTLLTLVGTARLLKITARKSRGGEQTA